MRLSTTKGVITRDMTSGHPLFQPDDSRPFRVRGDAFGRIMRSVSEAIGKAARGGGPVALSGAEAVSAVVRGAVRGALGVAANAVVGAKAIVMGVMRGMDERGDAALKILSCAARAVLRQTAELNGDMGAAARGVVLGAISSAKHMEVYPPRAASAARNAILDEAGKIGSGAAERVRCTLRQDGDDSAVPLFSPFSE